MATNEQVRQTILDLVSNGIKAVDLFSKLAEWQESDFNTISAILESMVLTGEVIELEYVLPNMNYRVKTIYFPAGTEIRNGQMDKTEIAS